MNHRILTNIGMSALPCVRFSVIELDYLFLAIVTVIKPKTPIAIAGPIVVSDKKVHTANAMQSNPTISRSFLISLRLGHSQFWP